MQNRNWWSFIFFFKSFVLYRSYFFLVMLKMCDFFFVKLQSDLAFIVSLCCLYCSIITIKKKESKKKNWGSHWNMVLIIIESYGLKNPFHLTSEVLISSTELWLPVTRNKSIEGTSYQFINITYDYLESSLVWFNFANSPRRDVKLGMCAGKILKSQQHRNSLVAKSAFSCGLCR